MAQRLCLFNLYAEYIMRNAGLEEAQAGIKIARRNTPLLTARTGDECAIDRLEGKQKLELGNFSGVSAEKELT